MMELQCTPLPASSRSAQRENLDQNSLEYLPKSQSTFLIGHESTKDPVFSSVL